MANANLVMILEGFGEVPVAAIPASSATPSGTTLLFGTAIAAALYLALFSTHGGGHHGRMEGLGLLDGISSRHTDDWFKTRGRRR